MRVLYPGAFDLLHGAHVKALQAARRIAGKSGTLIAAVNSDDFMRHYKRDPRRSQTERIDDVIGTGLANDVILWHGPNGQDQQILDTGADIYIAGTDWLGKDLAKQLGLPHLSWFDEHHISLLFLRRTPGISTTLLIEGQ